MPRIVSVWLPHWPIERLGRHAPDRVPAAEPLALVEAGARGLTITAVNACAGRQGVRAGLALADARAALPRLATLPAEPGRDRAALTGLVRWLGRYGPARNRDGADGAWIDVTGVPHLFGGESALLADLVGRLAARGITARAGLGDTLGSAHALCRWGTTPGRPCRIAPPGHAREALAALPVDGLRLEPATVRLLERLGLKRIGDLYGLPRAALERRFRERRKPHDGAQDATAVLLRLDQALGLIAEPRAPLLEPPDSHVRLPFVEPLISAEGIAAALARLAADLGRRLEGLALGGRRFTLRLYRVDGTVAVAAIATSAPSRDPGHLRRLLEERLSRIDAGFGIDLMELAAAGLEPLVAGQGVLGEQRPAGAGRGACALIDRLTGRLGAAAVVRLEPSASHVPERAQHPVPALAGAASTPFPASAARARRPAALLAPPEPVAVVAEIPDGAPVRLLWRRVLRRIVRAEGPERIAPEWWRALPAGGPQAANGPAGPRVRDYYHLEDEAGAGYWVFREGRYGEGGERPPLWFVHGVFA